MREASDPKHNGRLSVVYLGTNGFPHGFAPIQRQTLIALGLLHAGANVLIVNFKGVHLKGEEPPSQGTFRGIDYIYTSGSSCRPAHLLSRNLLKVKGIINETLLLWRKGRNKELDIAIVATTRFHQICYYYLLSRILTFKVLLNLVEQNTAIDTRTSWREKVNDFLVHHIGLRCTDAILPISHYLETKIRKRFPTKPQLRIPIIADFDFTPPDFPTNGNFILYCGTAAYLEVIQFVIKVFEVVSDGKLQLHLVVNGNRQEMLAFHQFIDTYSSPVKPMIHIFSSLSSSDLMLKYSQAFALLIPLRPTIQDKARFPHKIGEYLASGSPMITTAVGEINYFFKDGVTAFIVGQYDVEQFAAKLQEVLDNPQLAEKVGKQGLYYGREVFNFQSHGIRLLQFMEELKM